MFGKFMNKKFFHPGSYPNVKMKWIHEQRDMAKKKNEEEKQATYQKEQESYQSRMLSAKTGEEKMKLDLNFLYDLPPGMKNNDEEEDKEKEVKFEWQKHAPRSRYVNDLGLECADQPFGVCVRNIRCFKCRAWGHQNTDRECPLFFANVNSEENTDKSNDQNLRLSDPLRLVSEMKEQHGLSLKKSVIGQEINPMAENQQLIASDDENGELNEADFEFIESLTDKQKQKLLKRLNKLEKKERKRTRKKERKAKTEIYEKLRKYSPSRECGREVRKRYISSSSEEYLKTNTYSGDAGQRRTQQKYSSYSSEEVMKHKKRNLSDHREDAIDCDDIAYKSNRAKSIKQSTLDDSNNDRWYSKMPKRCFSSSEEEINNRDVVKRKKIRIHSKIEDKNSTRKQYSNEHKMQRRERRT